MATRPWVQPEEVKAYTSQEVVENRPAEKLAFDISRAELKVMSKTNNKFETYDAIPEPVKMAVILLAEAYARNVVEAAKEKQLKSETFDDYSYTVESSTIDIEDLDIDDLLADYVLSTGRGKTVMRLRKL